ncbi:MAG: hypothetical protein ACI9UT_003411 [Flavobacteriales bacterium]
MKRPISNYRPFYLAKIYQNQPAINYDKCQIYHLVLLQINRSSPLLTTPHHTTPHHTTP